jgi:hypothetical protein
MPPNTASSRRQVVPGLDIAPVKPTRTGKPPKIAIMRSGASLTLSLATVPGFLSLCSQMRQALRQPMSLRDGSEFSCPTEGDNSWRSIELRQHLGTNEVSIWSGGQGDHTGRLGNSA